MDLGNTASFTYDPFGRRATKSIGTSSTFLYDGANPVQEVIGGTNTANSLMGGLDEVFQRTDSGGVRNFLTDALGGTLGLTDSSGTLQTQYTFEPFGNGSVTGAATTNSFAYTGRKLDAIGLDFYRARYYNPALQRFISEDPMSFGGGSVNFYEYAYDNPINLIDPFGLQSTFGPGQALALTQAINHELDSLPPPPRILLEDPDYVTIGGGLGYWSPNIILTNDNVYVTVFGLGMPGGSPLYANVGYLDGNHSQKDIDDFVNQWGGSACAFMGAGGCRTWAPRNKWATELGIGAGCRSFRRIRQQTLGKALLAPTIRRGQRSRSPQI